MRKDFRRKFYYLAMFLAVILLCLCGTGHFPLSDPQVDTEYILAARETPFEKTVDFAWAQAIAEETGVIESLGDGSGIKVGLVDTGIDVRVIDPEKVSNFTDLTKEGTVSMSEPMSVSPTGSIVYGGRMYDVRGVETKSGFLRVGVWKPRDAIGEGAMCQEFLDATGEVAVLVADNYLPEQYDTVYIDTNLNGSFSDEVGLEVYRNSKASVFLRSRTGIPGVFSIVVCDIFHNGQEIVLGFDGHGHGTSVASILTGYENVMRGIAPGADLAVVKAVESSGRTSWSLLKKGIEILCEQGVKIIIMSVAPMDNEADLTEIMTALDKAGRDYGATIVVPSGNQGPGLETMPSYVDLQNVIAVGGYIPSSASYYLGWDVSGTLWPWSSIGPTDNGNTVTVIAPAVAPALAPLWMSELDSPRIFEGTSCSAAYVGGVLAILTQHQEQTGRSVSAFLLKRAIREGAQTINSLQPVEQGSGLINGFASVEAISRIRESTNLRAVLKWESDFKVNGFFDRNRLAGYVPMSIDNFSPFSVRLKFSAPKWIFLPAEEIGIPAVEQRETSVRTVDLENPGLYSGWLRADDHDIPGEELSLLWTAIVPRSLDPGGYFGTQQMIWPGDIHREYIKISEGIERLDVTAGVIEDSEENPRGRIKVYVYDEKGTLAYESDWIGKGAERRDARAEIRLPGPGVWEIDVLSDPVSSSFGAREAVFKLSVSSKGLVPVGLRNEIWAQGSEPSSVSSEIDLLNTEETFSYKPILVVFGENGEVSIDSPRVTASSALTKSLPEVPPGAKYLYVSTSNPKDLGADLNIYLYYFDKDNGKWKEVSSSAAKGESDEEIALVNPKPGQYIAYIEALNLTQTETAFRWISAVVKGSKDYKVLTGTGDKEELLWAEGEQKTLRFIVPSSLAEAKEVFLTVWDSASGRLRGIVPVHVHKGSPTPFVYVGKGASFDGKTAVTIRAWEPYTFKPIDALVSLDDVWYQLYDGQATVILNRESINGISLSAYYPGMGLKKKILQDFR